MKCRERAIESIEDRSQLGVWWPGLSRQVLKNCPECTKTQKRVDTKKIKLLKSIFSLSWDDYLTNSGLSRL